MEDDGFYNKFLGKRGVDFSKLGRRDFMRISALTGAAALGGMLTGSLYGCHSKDDPELNYELDVIKLITESEPILGYRPNIVIINADDLGYGDLGCYGGGSIRTPNIDRLANEGVRFTDFYSCNALCSPSRAGLLTGRYPQRSGVTWPIWPKDESFKRSAVQKLGHTIGKLGVTDMGSPSTLEGIQAEEITLSEALKSADYKTGMVGKWHLGDLSKQPEYNPLEHGFDFFFRVPHSNDMFPCPLYNNREEIEADIGLDQARLTGLYTEKAVEFIENSKDTPFFFYFAHTFPHQPLYASERFKGKSLGGIYGDTVEEVDWSVGEVLDCLKRNGLDRKTLVIFTSDNGPWFEGSPGELRGRKGQSYEGGFRVPMIARFPGHIPPGSICEEPAMNIDIFPTCLELAGFNPPVDRVIDGVDMNGLLTGRSKSSPHEALFFYHQDELEGVRMGRWKYFRNIHHYVYPVPMDKETKPMGRMGRGRLGKWPLMYDMENDPGENYNVIDTYPEIGRKLLEEMERWEREMAANPRGWIGGGGAKQYSIRRRFRLTKLLYYLFYFANI